MRCHAKILVIVRRYAKRSTTPRRRSRNFCARNAPWLSVGLCILNVALTIKNEYKIICNNCNAVGIYYMEMECTQEPGWNLCTPRRRSSARSLKILGIVA